MLKLNEENKDLPKIENRTDNIISDIQIRENEIEDILHTLDPQKASGTRKENISKIYNIK
jgi:hypothetical protein